MMRMPFCFFFKKNTRAAVVYKPMSFKNAQEHEAIKFLEETKFLKHQQLKLINILNFHRLFTRP